MREYPPTHLVLDLGGQSSSKTHWEGAKRGNGQRWVQNNDCDNKGPPGSRGGSGRPVMVGDHVPTQNAPTGPLYPWVPIFAMEAGCEEPEA